MGACCGKETNIIVRYLGHTVQFNNITSIELLAQKAKAAFKENDKETFCLFLNKTKLSSDNQLAQACRSSSQVIIDMAREEAPKIVKSDPLYSVSQQVVSITRGDIHNAGVLLTPNYILMTKTTCPNKSDIPSLFVNVPDLKIPVKLREKVHIDLNQDLVILELEIDENTEAILAKRKRINFETKPISQAENVNSVFYPPKRSNITIEKSQATTFDQNNFQLAKPLPKEAQGGVITDSKGNIRGIIIESGGGKGNAVFSKRVIDQIQQLAREGNSREKRVCAAIAEKHDIDIKEVSEIKEEVIVTLIDKEPHDHEIDIQMVSNTKKKLQEAAEEIIVEQPDVEINFALNVGHPKNELQYLEAGFYINPLSNKLVGYHPSEYSVNHYDITIDLKRDFTLTQTSIGVVIVSGKMAWLWDTDVFLPLASLNESHKKHTATVFNNSLVVISGKDSVEVEALNLQSMT